SSWEQGVGSRAVAGRPLSCREANASSAALEETNPSPLGGRFEHLSTPGQTRLLRHQTACRAAVAGILAAAKPGAVIAVVAPVIAVEDAAGSDRPLPVAAGERGGKRCHVGLALAIVHPLGDVAARVEQAEGAHAAGAAAG